MNDYPRTVNGPLSGMRRDQDELDVIDALVKGFSLVKRFKYYLLAMPFVVLIGAWAAFQVIRPVYSSEFICSIPSLSKEEVKHLLNHFEVREKASPDNKVLKVRLINDEFGTEDHTFIIGADVTDPSAFAGLQANLIAYFDTNPYVASTAQRTRAKASQVSTFLRSEETRVAGLLDQSIKAGVRTTISDLTKLKIDIHRELIEANERLELANSVTTLQDFQVNTLPINKSFIRYYATGIGLYICALISLAAAGELRRSILKRQIDLTKSRILVPDPQFDGASSGRQVVNGYHRADAV